MDEKQKELTFDEALKILQYTTAINGKKPDYILIGRDTLLALVMNRPVMYGYFDIKYETFLGIPLERVEAAYRFKPVYKGRF